MESKETPFGRVDGPGVYHEILLSFDRLPSEARKLFLICCHFPEGYVIKVEKLARCNLALGLSGVSEARNKFFYLIECLKSESLLQEGDVNDDSEDQTVMVHNVVRAVGLYIVSGITVRRERHFDQKFRGTRSVTLEEDVEDVNEFSDQVESVVHEYFQKEYASPSSMTASVGPPPAISPSLPDEKDLANSSSLDQNNRILVQGIYVKAEMKPTFEEILTANPNFLSKLRFKKAEEKTFFVESAICCLDILRQCTACTISPGLLASFKDSLDDLEASGLDLVWLERGYKRASLVLEKEKVVSALAELARLERKTAEVEADFELVKAKLEHLKVLRDASKAECDALMQEEKAAGNELFGGGFSVETSLGDGLLD